MNEVAGVHKFKFTCSDLTTVCLSTAALGCNRFSGFQLFCLLVEAEVLEGSYWLHATTCKTPGDVAVLHWYSVQDLHHGPKEKRTETQVPIGLQVIWPNSGILCLF